MRLYAASFLHQAKYIFFLNLMKRIIPAASFYICSMRYIFFLLLISMSNGVKAQKQGQHLIDSLLTVLPAMKADSFKVKALHSLSYEYSRIDVDEGIRYGSEALQLSRKTGWKKGEAIAYRLIGINYLSVSVLDTALENLEKSLAIFSATSNKEGAAKVYGNMGNLFGMQGDKSKALEFHLKALGINEDLEDERTIAANLSNISVIYFDMGKVKEAIEMQQRAVGLNKKYNNKTYLVINYHELSRYHEFLKEYDKAFEYSKQAYGISNEIGDKNGMALGLDGMGYVEEYKKNYARALGFYKEALDIRTRLDDKMGISGSLGNIAICYLAMSKEYIADRTSLSDSSILYSKKGIALAKEIGNVEWQKINYNTLSEAQELQGDYQASLASYRLSVKLQDSLFNSDKKESIKNLEDKREIELRDKQLKINELEIDNRKRLQWLFIAGIGFLVLIGLLLLRQTNIRKRNNQQLQLLNTELVEANETKTRFLGILNHDLRSPVANLIQFLGIQKNAPELLDAETRNRMELQTMTGAENLLQSMEDLLLWSKGQMQYFKPVIKPTRVKDLFDTISNHFYSTQQVRFIFENQQDLFVNTDENFLLTIMRNLTGNAVKALHTTPAATIIWKATLQDGKTVLSVTDNGPGIEAGRLKAFYNEKEVSGINSGFGLHLVRDLAKAIDCTVAVKSENGSGTVFRLSFQ